MSTTTPKTSTLPPGTSTLTKAWPLPGNIILGYALTSILPVSNVHYQHRYECDYYPTIPVK
eukprot:5789671-Pyramimonas_sp.AAC.3